MTNRLYIYWLCQLTGWGMLVLGNFLFASVEEDQYNHLILVSVLTMVSGIGITHTFRWIVHRLGWARYNIPPLLPRVLISAVTMSVLFFVVNTVATDLVSGSFPFSNTRLRPTLLFVLNISVVFLIWEMIYFAVKTFENWKREEITNLELRAAKTEIELNSFKSQINPHFIFNSLNSIRALVDEDPDKAKRAITMLSGILRNNLMLGKRQLVTLGEEMDLVEKYLSIEKIRFEERLNLTLDVPEETLSCQIPPFMLQTIVENAVKHGISRRTEGGDLLVKSRKSPGMLELVVSNTGSINQQRSADGIGVANTIKRLDLLFGTKASFKLEEIGKNVVARLEIPQHQ